MKKVLFFGFLLAIVSIMATGCDSCQSGNKKQGAPSQEQVINDGSDYDGVVKDFTACVSHIQALHRQTMFALIDGGYYEWRNSKVLFNDSITFGNIDELKVVEVTDVFCYFNDEGPQVQFIASNVEKGTIIPHVIHDVWIEDASLNNKEIKLSAEDVLAKLKEWNGVLPPAVCMNLRYPVGPCECNAQWVIGNAYDVIFVDAVTGDISNWNPAFNPNNKPKGGDFGKPLGEWP